MAYARWSRFEFARRATIFWMKSIHRSFLRKNPAVTPRRNAARSLYALGLTLALTRLFALAGPAHSEEVPFVTSPDNVTLEMLNMAGVKRGDHVLDLGSGDGRIVILAARRFGATGLGVELDPALVALSNAHARSAGVDQRAAFREQDLFKTDLSSATVITMYLLPEVNLQLRPALLALKPGTRLVSHDWDMGDWVPDRTTVLPVPNKKVGLEKSSKVHLWVVPARLDGLWCGTAAGTTLRFAQRYQLVTGTLAAIDRSRGFVGQISGAEVRAVGGPRGALALRAQGNDELRVTSSRAELALSRGQTFRRASADSCKN
jgi:SAM-dependent methyltransferase